MVKAAASMAVFLGFHSFPRDRAVLAYDWLLGVLPGKWSSSSANVAGLNVVWGRNQSICFAPPLSVLRLGLK